jgi:hypothetical protein
MQKSKPFGRSLAFIAEVNAAFMAFAGNTTLRQQAITELSSRKEFQSRGHGRNKRSGVNVKALNKMYRHDTRRVRKGAPVPKALVATPCCLWYARTSYGDTFVTGFKRRKDALALLKFEGINGTVVLH